MSGIVTPKKVAQVKERMVELNLKDEDLVEQFVRGSGSGGQNINKTANADYLKHVPTGIEVKVQKSRSLQTNRFLARRLLVEKYESQVLGVETKADKLRAKKRKQKERRMRRSRSGSGTEKKEPES